MFDYIHITLMAREDCKNPDSYGCICIRCNACGRFDEKGMEDKDGED